MRKLSRLRIWTVSVSYLGLLMYLATATANFPPLESVVMNHTNSNSAFSTNGTRIIVELPSIGFDGTLEHFCDPKQMQVDYETYPKHELRKIRSLVCDLRRNDSLDRSALSALAAYKYCVVMRPRIDAFLLELVNGFAENDQKKKELLLTRGPVDNSTTCYKNCLLKFTTTCVEEENPYLNMFKPLIARACEMYWLAAQDIRKQMEKTCIHRLIVGKIDWKTILDSINYRVE